MINQTVETVSAMQCKIKIIFRGHLYTEQLYGVDCGILILFIFRIPYSSNSFVIVTMTLSLSTFSDG